MSAKEAKRRQIEAEAAAKAAAQDEVDAIEAESIKRYEAIEFPGVKTFSIGKDVPHGYCKAVAEMQRRKDVGVRINITSPMWIAELDNGATVVQCAESGTYAPQHFDRYIVFYNDGPPTRELPQRLKPMVQECSKRYLKCIALPVWRSASQKPAEDDFEAITAFYSVCPRHTLVTIRQLLQTETERMQVEFDPPFGFITVLNVVSDWQALDCIAPALKKTEKVVFEYTIKP